MNRPLYKGHCYIEVTKVTLPIVIILLLLRHSKRGQPLYKGQNGLSPTCPLFGGSTVYSTLSIYQIHTSYIVGSWLCLFV